jgi:hypothetical protein
MRPLLLLFLALVFSAQAEAGRPERTAIYSGMADASAAVAVSSNLFVAASDEDNILRLYRNDRGGVPIKEFDFNAFLDLQGKSAEADLEGAALIGGRAFWICSHGRNKNGKYRPNRCRLFATDIELANGEVTLTPVGQPYKRLLEELAGDARFGSLKLDEAARRAPKEAGALNIEALAATPEGHLLIGFRNPIPGGKALIIPLLNPNEVIAGKPAKFDAPILLDLGGLGIRDMAAQAGSYLIIAGSYHAGGKSRLYRWAGAGMDPELLPVKHMEDYNPEALIIYPGKAGKEIQILSDDGNLPVEGIPGKEVSESSRKAFRSFWVVP